MAWSCGLGGEFGGIFPVGCSLLLVHRCIDWNITIWQPCIVLVLLVHPADSRGLDLIVNQFSSNRSRLRKIPQFLQFGGGELTNYDVCLWRSITPYGVYCYELYNCIPFYFYSIAFRYSVYTYRSTYLGRYLGIIMKYVSQARTH